MRWLLVLLIIPISITAFQSNPISISPVVGLLEIPFNDPYQKVQRTALVWYPVEANVPETKSANPWSIFSEAINAPIALSRTGPRPTIIISHGYLGNPYQLSWLILGLVQNGFIVAGVQHRDLINDIPHVNHWQRARDISLVIDQLEKSTLSNAVDRDRIGISGFSLGGTTCIWVAGGRSTKLDTLIPPIKYASPEDYVKINLALPTLDKQMMAQSWRDDRVKAAFAMAPAWAWLFDERSLEEISIPFYIVAGRDDRTLVTANNAGFFASHIPEATYQVISGPVGHFIFISAMSRQQQNLADPQGNLSFLFTDGKSVDRRWIQSELEAEASRFFNESL